MNNSPCLSHQSDRMSPSAVTVSSPGMTPTLWAYWGGIIALWLSNCAPGGSFLISNRWRALWGRVIDDRVIESKNGTIWGLKKKLRMTKHYFIFSLMIHLSFAKCQSLPLKCAEQNHLHLIQSELYSYPAFTSTH